MWPDETWQQMLVVVWGMLLATAVPLLILTPAWRRRGKDVKGLWIKYAAWFVMIWSR